MQIFIRQMALFLVTVAVLRWVAGDVSACEKTWLVVLANQYAWQIWHEWNWIRYHRD